MGDWFDNLGSALDDMGGVVTNGFGAAMDFVSGAQPGYDANGNQLQSHQDQMLMSLGKMFHDVKTTLGPVGDALAWTMRADQWAYSNLVSRPISTVFAYDKLLDSAIWKRQHGYDPDSFWDSVRMGFDPDLYKEAWRISKHYSPGRGFAEYLLTTDIEDKQAMEDDQKQWWFNLISGSGDAVTSFSLDPLGKIGKITKLGRLTRTTKDIDTTLAKMSDVPEVSGTRSLTSPPRTLNPTPGNMAPGIGLPNSRIGQVVGGESPGVLGLGNSALKKTLDWTQHVSDTAASPKEAAVQIAKHPMLSSNPNGGLIAGMLADASRSDKDTIMRVALGDPAAYKALSETRNDLAKRLETLYDVKPDLIGPTASSDGAGNFLLPAQIFMHQLRVDRAQAEVTALERQQQHIADLIGPAPLSDAEKAALKAQGKSDETINEMDTASQQPGIFASVNRIPKGGIYTSAGTKIAEAKQAIEDASTRFSLKNPAASEGIVQWNPFNAGVRVLGAANHLFNNTAPTGLLDTNDPMGHLEINNMLARVKGMSPETRQRLVGAYMTATTPGARLTAALTAEQEAIKHAAQYYGADPDAAGAIMQKHLWQRDQIRGSFSNRAYAPPVGPDGVRVDLVDESNTPVTALPLLRSQLVNKVPLTNIDVLQRAFARNQNILRSLSGKYVGDVVSAAGDLFTQAWKLTSFMRLGYAVRVLTDDEMAYAAKLNAMVQLQNLRQGLGNFGFNQWNRLGRLGEDANAKLTTSFSAWRDNIKPGTSNLPKNMTPGLPRAPRPAFTPKRIGQSSVKLDLPSGVTLDAEGFSPQGWKGDYWSSLTQDERHFLELYEGDNLRQLRGHDQWGLVNYGDSNYYQAWAHVLNTQYGQDTMVRKLLAGSSVDDILKWLRSDPAGIAYARDIPFRSKYPEEWITNVASLVNYLAPTKELRAAALTKGVSEDMLAKLPNSAKPHQINGRVVSMNMGSRVGEPFWGMMDKFRTGFYKLMNEAPTDVLVRHPLANALYNSKLNELAGRIDSLGGTVDNAMLRKLENQSRTYAVNEINNVLLQLSTHSNAAHVFRFVSPFYNAWDKALRRWGRLVYGDPGLIFRAADLWQGLNNVPLMFDNQGDVEDSSGKVLAKGSRDYTGLANADQQLLTFRMPSWLVGKTGLKDYNLMHIPKSTFNLVLQGDPWYLPSFGPVVQVPVSKLVENKPYFLDSVKAILPYGPQSVTDSVVPSVFRKYADANNDNGQSIAAARVRIYQTQMAKWIEGGRQGPTPDPFSPSIEKQAHSLLALKFISQLISPVGIQYNTPYKFYIDEFRKLQQQYGPATYDNKSGRYEDKALDQFLNLYPDYFIFTQSINKNNSGIPATVDAFYASKKYSGVLAQNPDVASAIIGPYLSDPNNPNANQFNGAVYRDQLSRVISPATAQTSRSPQSLADFAQNAKVNEGWYWFNKATEGLRIALANRKLVSFNQQGAGDLQKLKSYVAQAVAAKFPEWGQAYQNYDSTQHDKVITQLQRIATDPTLTADPKRTDIATLSQYMDVRNMVLGALAQRLRSGGSGDITAGTNRDLLEFWEYQRDRLAGSDTLFSQFIFDRYLSQDDLLKLTKIDLAALRSPAA